ncbi:M48 family metallopeptidase [Olsenella uli]|uniref:M48 family metallopeptidase n=1 Tax=Olsenella uli TaxID=133926 RepID=UPI00325FD94F
MLLTVSDVNVEVVRKDIKNMHLRVQPPDGRVVLSAPHSVSDMAIDGFVASKLAWIRKQRAEIAAQERQTEREGVTGETMYVWGKQCFVTVVEGSFYSVDLAGQDVMYTVRAGSSAEQREAHMREWYREQLCREVERLLPVWEERTGLKCAEWKTKYMKTRWGSCNPEARRIWLNVQLAKHPVECLEYVILHELAHFVEKTHGPKFVAVMDEYMPAWRSIRKQLNDGMLDYIG